LIKYLFTLGFIAILTSCSSMQPSAVKRVYCNTLKSNMVFSGATGITRDANIQATEMPLEERNYDQADC